MKYLRFHLIVRVFLFTAQFLVLQNHTADAIFNFLTTLPKREAFIVDTLILILLNIVFQ